MLGIFGHVRSTPPNAGDIARRAASLEQRLKRVGKRAPVAEEDGLGEAVAAALSGIAERFRGGASSIGEETTNLGNEAVKLGNAAWRRVAKEVESPRRSAGLPRCHSDRQRPVRRGICHRRRYCRHGGLRLG
jgi:hypothetical protein